MRVHQIQDRTVDADVGGRQKKKSINTSATAKRAYRLYLDLQIIDDNDDDQAARPNAPRRADP